MFIKKINKLIIDKMSAMDIRKFNTGTKVMLSGKVKPVNAMEDLTINFVM